MTRYEVESVARDGGNIERDLRLIGRPVELIRLEEGRPAIFRYLDTETKGFKTSFVLDIEEGLNGGLRFRTENTSYILKAGPPPV